MLCHSVQVICSKYCIILTFKNCLSVKEQWSIFLVLPNQGTMSMVRGDIEVFKAMISDYLIQCAKLK